MEMERQNKKMQVWNLLAEKIRKLVEESVSNPEELQEIRIRTGQPLLIQMKGQERVLLLQYHMLQHQHVLTYLLRYDPDL